jgi:hypothetical protein
MKVPEINVFKKVIKRQFQTFLRNIETSKYKTSLPCLQKKYLLKAENEFNYFYRNQIYV